MVAVFETRVNGKTVRSPDHPAVITPGARGRTVALQVSRSRAFERHIVVGNDKNLPHFIQPRSGPRG